MSHRDQIIIQKILSEIDIGIDMMGKAELKDFLVDEKLKRAISMTIFNMGELVKNITEETRKEYMCMEKAISSEGGEGVNDRNNSLRRYCNIYKWLCF